MDNVLVYPSKKQLLWESIESSVATALVDFEESKQQKIKQQLLDSISRFEDYFSSYELSLPDFSSADQIKAVKNRMETDFQQKSDLLATIVGLSLSNIIQNMEA